MYLYLKYYNFIFTFSYSSSFLLHGDFFLSRVFFLPIRPSLLNVYKITLEVENLIPNSLAASFIVAYFE